LICILSCRLGSLRLLFGVLSQVLSCPRGFTPFGLGRLAGFSVLLLLRLFQFTCLYGKRLVTMRFGSKILMSTIISLGVFYRDLLSLFFPLVGDVSFCLLLLMRFFLSCFFQFWKLFPFHKNLDSVAALLAKRVGIFGWVSFLLFWLPL